MRMTVTAVTVTTSPSNTDRGPGLRTHCGNICLGVRVLGAMSISFMPGMLVLVIMLMIMLVGVAMAVRVLLWPVSGGVRTHRGNLA